TGSQTRIGEFKNFSDGHSHRSGMGMDEKGVNCTVGTLSGTNRRRSQLSIPLSGDTPMYIGSCAKRLLK
ncbi:MAG: hypothetical protein ACPGAL_02245, partial [Luminiphilus sp.]